MRHGLFRKILAIGILILIFGTVSLTSLSGNISVVAQGVTIYVDDDNISGPWDGTFDYPYQNITSGLEHASNGDTVYVLNGTYEENVVIGKSVVLKGDSKPVIDGMGGMGARGIDIAANNVTVEGFNITNSVFGIYCNASGFSIINNIFWYDNQGFYWRIHEPYLAADYTVYGGVVENNEFYMNTNNDALNAYVALNYNYTSFYDVEIGDIQICNNTFHMEGTTATGIDIEYIYVEYLYGGTVSFGVLNMSENTIYGGDYGIDFYGYLEELQDVQASLGDVIIKNNVMVNQSSCGMYVDYYDGTYWYGNTVGTYGDLIITGNTITSVYGADGIYLSDIGYWYDFYGNASLEVGNVYIEENEIDVSGYGIYFYGYEAGNYLYDNSSFAMGHILVRDNTIINSYFGIYVDFEYFGYDMNGSSSFSMGNIEFSGNVVNSSYDGIYISSLYEFGYEMYDYASFVMGDILVDDNTINSDRRGIYVDFNIFGEYMYGASSFKMGNIEFSGNTINSTYEGIDFSEIDEFGYDMNDNASFTMGSILVNDNTIYSGNYEGIYVESFEYFGEYMYGNSSFTMGDIEFNNNFINTTDYGIYVDYMDYFGYYMYGNSSFTMGNVEFCGNEINSGYPGIYVGFIQDFGEYTYGTSSFVMGNIQFNDNTVNSDNYGIYFGDFYLFGYEMYGNSSFTMGNIEFSGNLINSTYEGIYIDDITEFGEYMYDNSSFTMGSILVNNNSINSANDGIYLFGPYYFGCDMYGSSSFTMGNIQFNDNTINSDVYGIYIRYLENFGDYMEGNAIFTMGNIEFSGNVINSTSYGIYFYYIYGFGLDMYGNSSFTMGNFSVNENMITSGANAIHLYYLESFGYAVYDNAIFTMGSIEFGRNTITNSDTGIYLEELENATIRNNLIQNCSYGIYLVNSANNLIYHNIFNNTINAYSNWTNTWDNGYPSGGNYWSDYNGTDLFSGPYQNVTGSDGIGDTPYDIQIGNQDRYPFTTQLAWDQTPPSITTISQNPEIPDHLETVTVTVVVTDEESGVHNVTLSYSTNSGETWTNVTMQKTTGATYQGEIPGQPAETQVQYKIIAYDNVGNPAVEDKAGEYYVYTVIPEFPTLTSMMLILIALTVAIAVYKRRQLKTQTQ